jgi:hypothetical protein
MTDLWAPWIRDLKRFTTVNCVISATLHIVSAIFLSITEKEFFVKLVNIDATYHASEKYVLTHYAHEWTETNIFSVLMTIAILSAFSSCFGIANANVKDRITGEEPTHSDLLRRETNRRFFDFAITFSLLQMALLLAVGENDVFVLVSSFALVAIQWLFNYLLETEDSNHFHKYIYITVTFFLIIYNNIVLYTKYINVAGMDETHTRWILATNTIFSVLFFLHQVVQEFWTGLFTRSDKTTLYEIFSLFYKLATTWGIAFILRDTLAKHNPVDFSDDGYDFKKYFETVLVVLFALVAVLTILFHALNAQIEGVSSKSRIQPQKYKAVAAASNPADDDAPVLGANFEIDDDGDNV